MSVCGAQPVVDYAGALTRVAELTARQLDVFECLGRGMSNRQIAAGLGISEYTVKVHIGKIIDVLGLDSRLQIGIVAYIHMTGCSCGVAEHGAVV
ncbi:helix-turn-helix transcriptional regulator [Microbispora sp. RL4-1S]|uniref:Helix-turn-helix transcriptional regulator n=1 Tax=Microbispora oryzae TaxID=2806554 RepID=A0A941AJ49_9ACTN|nr:helix-turn-helix transcriptional regulator [Microbispora oryzae]MBP2705866.1 helix-turn-helix transcriptional regulator [Microbispora oryzae]